MKVRCINRPAGSTCPAIVEAPAYSDHIAVCVPQDPPADPFDVTPETVAFKIGTVPIRKFRTYGGWELVADFNELTVQA